MKKRISLLLTLIAVLCLGVAATFTAVPTFAEGDEVQIGVNLITDSTLDSGNMNGWKNGWANGTFQGVDTSEDAGGTDVKGSIKLENATRSNQHAATKVFLTAGQLYEISVWIKAENVVTTGGGTGVYLGLCEGSGDTNALTLGYYGSPATVGTRPWFKFTTTYTANVDGEHRVKLRLWGSSGTAWFDNIVVKAIDTATAEIVDPNLGFGDLTFWNAGWGHDESVRTHDAEVSHTDDGSGSAYIYHPTDPNTYASYIAQKINLTENTRYKFSGWIKTENIEINTANGNGGAYFSLDDKYVFRFGSGLGKGKGTVYSQDWTYYESEFTATYTGLHSFQLKMWGAWGKAWFDDVKVELVYDIDPEVLKHWTEDVEFPTDDGGFTMVGIGDTQGFAGSYKDRYYQMSEWIVSKKTEYNIQYAMHLGDIVDNPTDTAQWDAAVRGQKILQDGGVKYSLSPGNHDYDGLIGLTADQKVPRSLATYNSYFKKADYDAWLGTENFGTFDDSMDNSWHKFTVGEYKYMVIALEFGPRSEVIAWANELCAANPDYNVIITTHAYISGLGVLDDAEAERNLSDANGALTLWNDLVRKHANIFMAVGGHYVSYGVTTSILYGDHGNPVIQMKVDPQNILGGGEPMIALYRITDGTQVSTFYYSTYQNKYYAGSNFSLTLIKGKESLNGRVEVVKGMTIDLLGYKQLDGIPANATYTVSNEKLATVTSDGKLTAKGVGEITVTVSIDSRNSAYADKGCLTLATIPVKISGVKLEQLTATYDAAGATVTAGDTLDSIKSYITVNGKYNDGSQKAVTNFTLSLANGKTTLSEGENEVIVTSGSITTTVIVTAEKANNVTVTVQATNGSVTGLMEGNQIPSGVPTIVTATPDKGYMFVKWEDGSIDPERTINTTEDITVKPEFTLEFVNSNVNAYTGNEITDGANFEDSWAICGIRITRIWYIWDDNEDFKVYGMLNQADSPDVVGAYPEYKDTPGAWKARYTIRYSFSEFGLTPGFHKITMFVETENGAVHQDKTFYPFLKDTAIEKISPAVATINQGATVYTNKVDNAGNRILAEGMDDAKIVINGTTTIDGTMFFVGYYMNDCEAVTLYVKGDQITLTKEQFVTSGQSIVRKVTNSKPLSEGGAYLYIAMRNFTFIYMGTEEVTNSKGENKTYYKVANSLKGDTYYYVDASGATLNTSAFVLSTVNIIIENPELAQSIDFKNGLHIGENVNVFSGREYNISCTVPGAVGVKVFISGGTLRSLNTSANVRFEVTSETVTLKIQFYEKTYDITFVAGEGGSLQGELTQTVKHGASTAEVVAIPNEGYRFVKWSNSSTSAALVVNNVKSKQTYTATFEKITFAVVDAAPTAGEFLALVAGEGGSITCGVTSVAYGEEVTVTAVAAPGYVFIGWADGVTDATRTLTMTESLTLTATFEKDVYASIEAEVVEGTTVTEGDALSAEIFTVYGVYADGTKEAVTTFTVALAEGETYVAGENVVTITVMAGDTALTATVTVTAEALPEPSVEPTVEPTVEPSVEPTVEESVEPSVEPSVEESVEPSVEPSVEETVEPTVEPSVEETVEPSVETTVEPTVEPTTAPTVEPTTAPTTAPSVEPSKESEKDGRSCGTVAPTSGGNNAGGMMLLIGALFAAVLFLFRKKNA